MGTQLLNSLEESPSGLTKIGALIHPSARESEVVLRNRHANVESVVVHDLAMPTVNPDVVSGYDAIVHSAGAIHVARTQDWYDINTRGTLALARTARECGVRRFVFVSSNAAGGRADSRTAVITEQTPSRPLSHYGRSKLLAEEGLKELHKDGEFEVVILRPSMFYGPPVPDRHIDIYRRILQGSLPMIGSGDYARSVTYIDSLVQATKLALLHPAASGQMYYVVDDEIYTTRAICEAMAKALGVPLRTRKVPSFVSSLAYMGDRALASLGYYWQDLHLVGEGSWHVGISSKKAIDELGFQPNVRLEEGMRRAIEWCRSEGKLKRS